VGKTHPTNEQRKWNVVDNCPLSLVICPLQMTNDSYFLAAKYSFAAFSTPVPLKKS
jgi:hypothetical protein